MGAVYVLDPFQVDLIPIGEVAHFRRGHHTAHQVFFHLCGQILRLALGHHYSVGAIEEHFLHDHAAHADLLRHFIGRSHVVTHLDGVRSHLRLRDHHYIFHRLQLIRSTDGFEVVFDDRLGGHIAGHGGTAVFDRIAVGIVKIDLAVAVEALELVGHVVFAAHHENVCVVGVQVFFGGGLNIGDRYLLNFLEVIGVVVLRQIVAGHVEGVAGDSLRAIQRAGEAATHHGLGQL